MNLSQRISVCLAAFLVGRGGLFGAEPDLLDWIRQNPRYETFAGVVHADRSAIRAAESLSDIPRPWTVPGLIKVYEKTLWQPDAPADTDWNAVEVRLHKLIAVLGASRDPRAAQVLIQTIEYPNVDIRMAAASALRVYFMPQRTNVGPRISSNVVGDSLNMVKEWWAENGKDLGAKAQALRRGEPEQGGGSTAHWVQP